MESKKQRGGFERVLFRGFCSIFISILLILTTVSAAESISLSYDKNGNLAEDNDFVYSYNSFNQLSLIKDKNGKTVAEFFYDESGQRIKKVSYDGEIKITYYLDDLVRETDKEGNNSKDTVYYYHDGQLIASEDSSGKFFYHPNNLGSTDVITDSQGNLVEKTSYLPFGAVIEGGNESRYLFTGQEADKETELMYFNARYYSPFLSRFIQPDTVLGNVYDPQQLNRYSYARNNPLKYTDPSGHWLHIVIGGVIGGIIGAGISIATQILQGEEINWGNVGTSAAIGAVGGTVAAATFGVGTTVLGGASGGLAAYSGSGAISGVAAGQAAVITSNAINNKPLLENAFKPESMLRDAAIGAALGAAGYGLLKATTIEKVKPDLTSGKVQEFPIEDLYGTHKLDNLNEIMKGTNKKPIDIFKVGDRLVVNDGLGRSVRSALEYGKNTVTGRLLNYPGSWSDASIYAEDLAKFISQPGRLFKVSNMIGALKNG